MSHPVPIYLFCGFLGSGKTTLLNNVLDFLQESGKKPAVVMNELGDINIDGQIIGQNVPMAEMLSGCICCTISGDLGMTIYELCQTHEPDVILIEATGVANPLEIINSVTETSLFLKTELKHIVTVIDAPSFLELRRGVKGRVYRLMGEQILAASSLILNKIDKVSAEDLPELEREIREWNATAPLYSTVYAQGGLDFLHESADLGDSWRAAAKQPDVHDGSGHHDHAHEHAHNHTHDHDHDHDGAEHAPTYHHSHDHVMVYTHYFDNPIQREPFEAFIQNLPSNVFRAKGVLQYADENSPTLFQYAFGQLESFQIRPQKQLPQVAVLIGEHLSKTDMALALEKLENDSEASRIGGVSVAAEE
ncbi:CobW family GTP-binding protein [Cohnella cellulosilytica]|uniref:CobW family GTP-binding protein n=1 Tax=Cohnella cellulosilytica TaxID=986710 RepID=A0ABW2FQ91_9BACL